MTADCYERTWFRDTEPNSSFVLTIDQLSAEQASTKPACGRHSAVAHARHVLAHIEMTIGFLRGEQQLVDWEETWSVQQMNDEDWATLRSRLKSACDELRERMLAIEDWSDPEWVKGAVADVAHAAYHLGAIRQIASEFIKRA